MSQLAEATTKSPTVPANDNSIDADDGRDLLTALDDEFFAEPVSNQERLRQVHAPVWMWVDTSDASCCSDGLCKECEHTI
jgi:hypothetical protein